MKIFVNRKITTGPWGGGNKILTELVLAAKKQNHYICHELEPNIDILLCWDPRGNKESLFYADLLEYKKRYNCKIIQRVGDIGTHGKPHLTQLVKATIQFSDFIIFPSNWAQKTIGYEKSNFEIIQNAPRDVFFKYRQSRSKPEETIRLITHHWSTNEKKGFEFYKFIDSWIENNKVEFTYIGRTPPGFKFKNAKHLPATGDDDLIAKTLANHDIYLTASQEEAGANHVLEGLASALPIIFYNKGGSINEYCNTYGLDFSNQENFNQVFQELVENFNLYKSKAMEYNDNISDVAEKYMKIICDIKLT
jgi:glycosyltransferase involved in cell wall biosynthesis